MCIKVRPGGPTRQTRESNTGRREHDRRMRKPALRFQSRAGFGQGFAVGHPGAAGSWALSNLAPRIIANNFAPGFFVEHFIKDMGIILDESRRMELCLPGLALVHQLYVSLKANGHGRDGTQALHLALAAMSNIAWKNR